MVRWSFNLRLSGALTVYRQLPKEQRADIEKIKCVLTTVFTIDVFIAFDQFTT